MMGTNEKRMVRILQAAVLLLSVPMIVIAFYSHPSVDDYGYGSSVHLWIQEHGYHVFGIIKCAAEFAYEYYFKWASSYLDSFTGALMPDNFGCYWISALIIYFLLTGGMLYLFQSMAASLGGKEYRWIGTVCALTGIVAVTQNWPSSAEALYWFDGAQCYMGYHAVSLWMCSVLVMYMFCGDKKRSIRLLVVSCVLAFLAGGGNNVTSFMDVLICCFFLGCAVLIKKKRGIVFPLIVSITGFLLELLAPGTAVRGGGDYGAVIPAIIKCFRWTLRQYILDWMNLGIGLMLLFLTPFLVRLMKRTAEKYSFRFPYPVLILAGGFCFLSAMSSPPFYILGESGPLRLRNLIYVNFVILSTGVYAYFLGWLITNKMREEQVTYIAGLYDGISQKYTAAFTLVMLIWLCAGNSQSYGSSLEAAKELLNGSAAQYHAEIQKRYELYEDPEVEVVVVEPLSVKPEAIFFDDITDDPENWKNISTAKYFDKKSVRLSTYDPEIDYE